MWSSYEAIGVDTADVAVLAKETYRRTVYNLWYAAGYNNWCDPGAFSRPGTSY